MPAGAELRLKTLQAGFETTWNTDVPATRVLRVAPDLQFTVDPNRAAVPEAAYGTGEVFATQQFREGLYEYAGNFTMALSFETLPWLMEQILVGNVVPTTPAAGAYLYTYTPSATNPYNTRSVTFEYNDGKRVQGVHGAKMTGVTIAGATGDTITAAPTFFAGSKAVEAATTGLSPITVELTPSRGANLYLDTGATAIGTTARPGELRSFTYTLSRDFHAKNFMDGANTPSDYGGGTLDATLQLVLEYRDTTWVGYYENGTWIKVRLNLNGSQIVTGQNKLAQFDIYGEITSLDWGDDQGNITQTVTISAAKDATAGTNTTVAVKNALASIV